MVEKIHFRVHYQEHNGGQIIHWSLEVPQWVLDNPSVEKCIIGKETDASRPHYQMYIEFSKTLSTFRQQFKKQFPDSDGNKDFSMTKVKNDESILSYVTKEGDYKTKGFSKEELDAIPTWKPKEQYKKEKLNVTKSRNTNEQIVIELQSKFPNKKWIYDGECMSIIISYIQKYYGLAFKQIGIFKVKDNALGILNSLNTGTLHRKLMNEAFPDLFGDPYHYEAD